MRLRGYIILILSLFTAISAAGQSTRVRGRVTDAGTGEPVAFASVAFEGTTVGITTDTEGNYSLETRLPVKQLNVFVLGYEQQSREVVEGSYNALDFSLIPITNDIERIVVKGDDRYVRSILDKIDRNRNRNDPSKIPLMQCSAYTKMELDLSNVEQSLKNRRIRENFGFIFEHVDTSAVTGKSFLPVMISESNARLYQSTNPTFNREVITASRISGVNEEQTLAQFTGQMHANVNLYDNFIDLFNIKFVSPLATTGTMFYDYYLIDSLDMDSRKTYKIRFHPKAFSTPVLDGEINIDAADYALRSAHVKMVKGLNINWIRDLSIDCESTLHGDSVWVKKSDNLFADFSLVLRDSTKMMSFLGRRSIEYSDIDLNSPIPAEIARLDNNVIMEQSVLNNDESYWQQVRPYRLTEKEQNIYSMVDSIKQVPLYRSIYNVANALFGGYYETKYLGFGPYYKLFSYNRLEDARLRMGVRTTSDWSKDLRLTGYVAYGTGDRRIKGGGSVEYMFSHQPMSKLTAEFQQDALQLGMSSDALSEGNFFGSVLSRGNMERLSIVTQGSLKWQKEWRHGFIGNYGIGTQSISTSKYVPMLTPDSTHVKSVDAATVDVGFRFSWNEIIGRGSFDRYYLYSDYPIISLRFKAGIKDIMPNDYEFYRVEAETAYDLRMPPFGTSSIRLQAGKIFGKVPYPLLKLHEGNGTYFYNSDAFSCMNYYEFASDTWLSLFYEHDFKGFLIGKFPLLKRLQLREVFTLKAVWGTLSKKNNGSLPATDAVLLFPEGMSSVTKPYIEMGVGAKNIFRIFRVDVFWRMTHRHKISGDGINNIAVNVGTEINF